jgi:hypothetical protein
MPPVAAAAKLTGSMGASSYILAGQGHSGSLYSAK